MHEILDEHASEVLLPHNCAPMLSIELQWLDELHRSFTSTRWKHRIPPAVRCASRSAKERLACWGLNAPVRLDATQLTDQQLQRTSTQRIREVIDQLRCIEPPIKLN